MISFIHEVSYACLPRFHLDVAVRFNCVSSEKTSTPTQLTVDRIFGSDEFRSEPVPFDKWMKSSSYTAPSAFQDTEHWQRHRSVRCQGVC